jgi:hypothetical protein
MSQNEQINFFTKIQLLKLHHKKLLDEKKQEPVIEEKKDPKALLFFAKLQIHLLNRKK